MQTYCPYSEGPCTKKCSSNLNTEKCVDCLSIYHKLLFWKRYDYIGNGAFSQPSYHNYYGDSTFAMKKLSFAGNGNILSLGTFLVDYYGELQILVDCRWEGYQFIAAAGMHAVLPSYFHNPTTNKVVSWEPELKLKSLRIFHKSSLSFSLQWQCPYAWLRAPQAVEICCIFYDESISSSGLKITSNYGPSYNMEVPWNNRHATIHIQTNFADNVHPNGTIINIPTSVQAVPHIFKFDYLAARYSSTSAIHKPSTPYTLQSIMLPGPYPTPTMLQPDEIIQLKTTCRVRAKSAPNKFSDWSSSVEFHLDQLVLPKTVMAAVKLDMLMKKQQFLEYDVHAGKYIQQKNNGNDDTFNILPLVDASQHGIIRVPEHNCDEEYDNCGEWHSFPHIPQYYRRRVGCYHWIFDRWYAFGRNDTTGKYQLASFGRDVGWNSMSGWTVFPFSAKYFPVDMKCPQLHSFLTWSEMDDHGDVHIMKISLDPFTGKPIDGIQQLPNEQLCRCSNTTTVTIPILEMVYRDLNKPEIPSLAVLCGTSVCGYSMPPWKLTHSSLIYSNTDARGMFWFALDQRSIFFLLVGIDCLFIDHQGTGANADLVLDRQFKPVKESLKQELRQLMMQSGDIRSRDDIADLYKDGRYLSVFVPKDVELLPVPPTECVIPQFHDKINMISKSAVRIHLTQLYNNASGGHKFAKFPVFYIIDYVPLFKHFSNESLPICRNGYQVLTSGEKLNCLSSATDPTRNITTAHTIENLLLDKEYFIQITALLDMEENLHNLWFAGAKFSTKSQVFRTYYNPAKSTNGYSLKVVFAVALPLAVAILLLWAGFIWWYKRKQYIYQHLVRLSSKDIHREEKLGQGNFGEVWKARMGRETIVVKALKESASDKEEKEFREEALLLSKFHSDFVVKAIGICLQTRPIMLALEFVNGGALDSYLRKSEVHAALDASDLLLVIKDALSGCLYLESEGYLHRDIAARNCLVSLVSESSVKPKSVKLSDFGLAKDIGNESGYSSRNPDSDVLPVAWTPPEGFAGKFSTKSDVWAFGVLIWEAFSFAATPYRQCSLGDFHHCPMEALNNHEVEYKVCVNRQTLADFPEPCTAVFPSALRKIFTLCWNYDPKERPSFQQLQNYLKGAQSEILQIRIPVFTQISISEETMDHEGHSSLMRVAYGMSTDSSHSQKSSLMCPAYMVTGNTETAEPVMSDNFWLPDDDACIPLMVQCGDNGNEGANDKEEIELTQ